MTRHRKAKLRIQETYEHKRTVPVLGREHKRTVPVLGTVLLYSGQKVQKKSGKHPTPSIYLSCSEGREEDAELDRRVPGIH